MKTEASPALPCAALARMVPKPLTVALLLLCCLTPPPALAAIQFDVFLGYDGIVPEASWFPVVCEVKNDGPTFNGVVELSGGGMFDQSLAIRLPVELPTGTLKRLVIPVFASMRGTGVWTVRLLDERGKTRAEQSNLPVRKQVPRNTPLLGAIARTAAGTPIIRKVRTQATDFQPVAARLLPSIFPDNPLVLEGLSSLYLNSERAAELSLNQVNAIFAWLNAGGHLIVAVEQPSDITSSPWLKSLFPCDVKELRTISAHPELQDWLRQTTAQVITGDESDANVRAITPAMRRRFGLNQPGSPYPVSAEQTTTATVTPFNDLRDDPAFESAAIQVAVGRVREGKVEVQSGDTPLIVTSPRGRGRLTALMFSPEREPMRSWKNLETFWARLADVPGVWYTGGDVNLQGSWSSDGIFGAMIDTRQVHRLPTFWLLLLLAGYLVVIGPLDQYWLKRIGKPMLTWITFPCYVVLFSLVIYLIGYKLRAGESEWNELHVVDVLPTEQGAELRGHTYSAVYSPSNQRYPLASQQRYATFRNSFIAIWSGVTAGSSEKASVTQIGDGFKADIFVPVWTSELYVTDWWQPSEVPFTATIRPSTQGWEVKAENRTDHKVTEMKLVVADRIYDLGELAPSEAKTFTPSSEQGKLLRQFVANQSAGFHDAVQNRQSALGSNERGWISDKPNSAIAACFLGELTYLRGAEEVFLSPPGLDLSAQLEHGNAFLLAWAPDYAPIKPMYQFHPRRSARDTLWRVGLTMN